MAKSKEDFIKELQELDVENKYPVKKDHNVADIELRIDYLKQLELNASLAQSNKDLKEEAEELKTERDDLAESAKALAEELKAIQIQTSSKSENPVISIKGNNYRVRHAVKLAGKSYSIAKIAENENVASSLIEKGSSAIEQVGEV